MVKTVFPPFCFQLSLSLSLSYLVENKVLNKFLWNKKKNTKHKKSSFIFSVTYNQVRLEVFRFGSIGGKLRQRKPHSRKSLFPFGEDQATQKGKSPYLERRASSFCLIFRFHLFLLVILLSHAIPLLLLLLSSSSSSSFVLDSLVKREEDRLATWASQQSICLQSAVHRCEEAEGEDWRWKRRAGHDDVSMIHSDVIEKGKGEEK